MFEDRNFVKDLEKLFHEIGGRKPDEISLTTDLHGLDQSIYEIQNYMRSMIGETVFQSVIDGLTKLDIPHVDIINDRKLSNRIINLIGDKNGKTYRFLVSDEFYLSTVVKFARDNDYAYPDFIENPKFLDIPLTRIASSKQDEIYLVKNGWFRYAGISDPVFSRHAPHAPALKFTERDLMMAVPYAAMLNAAMRPQIVYQPDCITKIVITKPSPAP